VLLAAFVLPGFVTLLISERTHAIKGEDSAFERLLGALYYSALIYAIAVAVAALFGLRRGEIVDFADGEWTLGEYLATGVVVVLALPLLIAHVGLLWRRSTKLRPWALNKLRVSPAHSTPSGWDHFFGQNAPALVRVTLTDGRVVGGYYGDESFAGYSDHHADLFLEQRWELDEDAWFSKPAADSLGLWLPPSSIVSFELYAQSEPEHAPASAPETEPAPAREF